jgi:hypothetical protein
MTGSCEYRKDCEQPNDLLKGMITVRLLPDIEKGILLYFGFGSSHWKHILLSSRSIIMPQWQLATDALKMKSQGQGLIATSQLPICTK